MVFGKEGFSNESLREPFHYRDWDCGNRSQDAVQCADILIELTAAEETFFLQCSSLETIRSLYEHRSPWIVGSPEHHACMLASLLHMSREPERAISVLQEALESLKTARPASRERVGSMTLSTA